jgi:hypothetical protein
MPEFFRKGAPRIAACSADPDLWKERATPVLGAAEGPNHFINLESLLGKELPKTRAQYARLCWSVNTDADKTGCLPYAIQEWYERLLLAFAEHRKAPGDEVVQAKILYIAGILAHYTEDAGQPLHTTIHYNGRARPDNTSPKTGIHIQMDALPEKVKLTAEEIAAGLKVEAVDEKAVFGAVLAAIRESHGRVETVYKLEARLPAWQAEPPAEPDKEVRALALDCCRTSALLTARMWYSAWVNSAKVKLPEWHGQRMAE